MQGNKLFQISFAAIFIINLFVFTPSFSHLFRSDHVGYLVETIEHDDVIPLCLNYLDYPHTRKYGRGDTFLFRPLQFVILGLQKGLFGSNYTLWHLTGFLLHITVVGLLLYLGLDIRNSWVTPFFVGLFSCMYGIIEGVIWEHLNSYQVFVIFVLAAIIHLRRFKASDCKNHKQLLYTSLWMLPACFIYENGPVFVVLFTLYAFYISRESGNNLNIKWITVMVLPVLFFICLYSLNSVVNTELPDYVEFESVSESEKMFSIDNAVQSAANIPLFMARLLRNGLFPGLLDGNFSDVWERVVGFNMRTGWLPGNFAASANYVAVIFLLLSLFFMISKKTVQTNLKLIVLISFMTIAYVAINSLGRTSTHDLDYLLDANVHYSYMFWCYMTVIFISMIDPRKINKIYSGGLKYLFVVGMVSLITINGYKTYSLNCEIRDAVRPIRTYLSKIDNFVKIYKSEPGFAFQMRDDIEIEMIRPNLADPNDFGIDIYYLTDILYGKYIDNEKPSYVIEYNSRSERLNIYNVGEKK